MKALHTLTMASGRIPGLQASPEARAMLHAFIDLLCDHMEAPANLFDVINSLAKVAEDMVQDEVPDIDPAYRAFVAQWFPDQHGGQ